MVHILILFLLHIARSNTALVSLLFGTVIPTSYDIVFTLVSLVFPYKPHPFFCSRSCETLKVTDDLSKRHRPHNQWFISERLR